MSGTEIDDHRLGPDDEAAAGTPGAGETICPDCGGSGIAASGANCPACDGLGRTIEGVGGA
jgi:hypothetical protein